MDTLNEHNRQVHLDAMMRFSPDRSKEELKEMADGMNWIRSEPCNSALCSRDILGKGGMPAGVLCDLCGDEMLITTGFVADTDPSQLHVDCPGCGASGHKLG